MSGRRPRVRAPLRNYADASDAAQRSDLAVDRLLGLRLAGQATLRVDLAYQGEDKHQLPAEAIQLGPQTVRYCSPISSAHAGNVALPRAKRRSFPNALSE